MARLLKEALELRVELGEGAGERLALTLTRLLMEALEQREELRVGAGERLVEDEVEGLGDKLLVTQAVTLLRLLLEVLGQREELRVGAGERLVVVVVESVGVRLLVLQAVALARAEATPLAVTWTVPETLDVKSVEGDLTGEPLRWALREGVAEPEGCAPLGEPLAVAHTLRLGLGERLGSGESEPEALGSAVAEPPVALGVAAPEALPSNGEGEKASLGEVLLLLLARGDALASGLLLLHALLDAEPLAECAEEGTGEAQALAEGEGETEGEALSEGSPEAEGVPEALGVVEGQ